MQRHGARYSFLAKMAVVVSLVAAADALFQYKIGSWLGGLMLAWAVMLIIVRPALRRGPVIVAAAAASVFALITADAPGLLGWAMFWVAISIAALLPQANGFDDAWRWTVRVAAHGVTGPFTPLIDLLRLFRPRPHRGRMTARAVAAMLALPLAMGVIRLQACALAWKLVRACQEILGFTDENLNVEFTQHRGDEMFHARYGGLSDNWVAGEPDKFDTMKPV